MELKIDHELDESKDRCEDIKAIRFLVIILSVVVIILVVLALSFSDPKLSSNFYSGKNQEEINKEEDINLERSKSMINNDSYESSNNENPYFKTSSESDSYSIKSEKSEFEVISKNGNPSNSEFELQNKEDELETQDDKDGKLQNEENQDGKLEIQDDRLQNEECKEKNQEGELENQLTYVGIKTEEAHYKKLGSEHSTFHQPLSLLDEKLENSLERNNQFNLSSINELSEDERTDLEESFPQDLSVSSNHSRSKINLKEISLKEFSSLCKNVFSIIKMLAVYNEGLSPPLPNFNYKDFQIANEIITMAKKFSKNKELKTILMSQCHFELLQLYSEKFKNLKDDNEKIEQLKQFVKDYSNNKDREKFEDLNTYLIENYNNLL
ncbi:hypothetical protein HERIO_660 [Hepatospora eriocheir]|uniref:Transmembrane protein n=1 Tax=Hepatospora eriocheir TaxID=1081669 RepID=A0A1X0QCE5_9MICR|nr:hypothetical protein HERIO_660 [Hepatospora eriocheir]